MKVTRQQFTDRFLTGLSVDRRTDILDPATTGLYFRVSPPSASGIASKVWYLVYWDAGTGKTGRVKIGSFETVGIAEARKKARALRAQIDAGQNPAAHRREYRDSDTFRDLALEWIEVHGKREKRSWRDDLRYLETEIFPAIGDRKARDIQRRDVRRLFEKKTLESPVSANRMLAVISAVFNWAISTDRAGIEVNPATLISKNKEKPRRTHLQSDEDILKFVELVNQDCGEGPCFSESERTIVMIALLTGQRSGEPRQVKKADIDLQKGLWTVTEEVSKIKNVHSIPLAPWALSLFRDAIERAGDSEYVFPSPVTGEPLNRRTIGRKWDAVRRGTGLDHINIHDLRRTMKSRMGQLKVSKDISHMITNHGRKKDENEGDRVYDVWNYYDEMLEALTRWENHLLCIVEHREPADNVVAIRA